MTGTIFPQSAEPIPFKPGIHYVKGGLYKGRVSWFGGFKDTGVSRLEGLALVSSPKLLPDGFFLPGLSYGLARRLNPQRFYMAMWWDYHETPISWLLHHTMTVTSLRGGTSIECQPVDFGPAYRTGRLADLSPGALKALGIQTDDTVTIQIPGE